MKLINLSLRNFKGRTFMLQADGHNLNVFGDNATGKTTLFDALQWLFFGKDSRGKADFRIKNLDVDGSEFHNMEHEVSGQLAINDKPVTLRKVYAEKWTKKRGSATSDFTGHETSYWIDGVPKSKKEYDAYIAGIVHEETFKLLTNPAFFNEQLPWQDRRRILLEVCGDIADADVIASDAALAKLPGILNGRIIADHKKVIAAKLSEINKELEKIPVRIDEATRALPDITGFSHPIALANEIASLKKQLSGKQQEIVRLENGGEIAEKQKAVSQIEGRLLDLRNKFRAENEDKLFAKRNDLQKLRLQLSGLIGDSRAKELRLTGIRNDIDNLKVKRETLITKWYAVDGEQLDYTADTVCQACGQNLPQDKIAEANQKAQEIFNLSKSSRLESINSEGRKIKSEITVLEQEQLEIQAELEKTSIAKVQLEQSIAALQAEIEATRPAETVETTPEYQNASHELLVIQGQIDAINSQMQSVLRQAQTEINMLTLDISTREKNVSSIEQREKGLLRIKELSEQEKTLGAEYGRLQGEQVLVERFIVAKVNLLESRINSKFKHARFKMFNVQVNGGVDECCEATYNGVPYSGGLNNGHRIIVGLDIIRTLSEHYGFAPVIFIDNSESVTSLPEMQAQVIRLVVSKSDKVLRVERDVAQGSNSLFEEAV